MQDDHLVEAFKRAERRVQREMETIRNRRFYYVANEILQIEPEKAFSPKACRERYVGLVNGTASIPIELDDNPQEREKERNDRIEQRRRSREDEQAAALAQQEQSMMKAKAAQVIKANAREEASAMKAKKLADKAKKAADRAATRLAEAAAAQRKSLQRAEHAKRLRTGPNLSFGDVDDGNGDSSSGISKILTKNITTSNNSPSPANTISQDPRAELTTENLIQLCKLRKLYTGGTRRDLLLRLNTFDDDLKMSEMRIRLRQVKRPITGNRDVLKYRLALADRDSCSGESASASARTTNVANNGFGVNGNANTAGELMEVDADADVDVDVVRDRNGKDKNDADTEAKAEAEAEAKARAKAKEEQEIASIFQGFAR